MGGGRSQSCPVRTVFTCRQWLIWSFVSEVDTENKHVCLSALMLWFVGLMSSSTSCLMTTAVTSLLAKTEKSTESDQPSIWSVTVRTSCENCQVCSYMNSLSRQTIDKQTTQTQVNTHETTNVSGHFHWRFFQDRPAALHVALRWLLNFTPQTKNTKVPFSLMCNSLPVRVKRWL